MGKAIIQIQNTALTFFRERKCVFITEGAFAHSMCILMWNSAIVLADFRFHFGYILCC